MNRRIAVISPAGLKRSAGIYAVTQTLFRDRLPIVSSLDDTASFHEEDVVVFSGFNADCVSVVRTLKARRIKVAVFWHFSSASEVDRDIGSDWLALLPLLRDHSIDLFISCKLNQPKLIERLFGVQGYFILNNASNPEIPASARSGVGIYSGSGDYWAKNMRPNLYAALAVGLPIDIIPFEPSLRSIVDAAGAADRVTGESGTLRGKQFHERLVHREAVLYCTLTEGSPLLPLEALNLGTLCLSGPNHNYFQEDVILRRYLVVNNVDDPIHIAYALENALRKRREILDRYRMWKKFYDLQQRRNLDELIRRLSVL